MATNPAHIIINHYSLLLQELQPLEVIEVMMLHNLLSEVDYKTILDAPLDHIRNCYIVEHVRHIEPSNLCTFVSILKEIPDQKHLWSTLVNGKCVTLLVCHYNKLYMSYTDHPFIYYFRYGTYREKFLWSQIS